MTLAIIMRATSFLMIDTCTITLENNLKGKARPIHAGYPQPHMVKYFFYEFI